MNWQRIMERLSIPGAVLLVLGAVACTQTAKLVKNERIVVIARFAGLALAVLGALILLDFIPGL